MDKKLLTSFVQKYYLNGLCNETKLFCTENSLHTDFITENKDLVGSVSLNKIDLPDSRIGIFNTSLLLRILNVMDDEITVNLQSTMKKYTSLLISDKSMSSNVMLADLDIIKDPPSLKDLPESDVELILSNDFINRFNKAKSAIPEANHMAFIQNGDSLELILNYAEHNSDNIVFELQYEKMHDIPVMKFNADNFKEILSANKESKSAILQLFKQGLMKVEFTNENTTANYYLVMLQ